MLRVYWLTTEFNHYNFNVTAWKLKFCSLPTTICLKCSSAADFFQNINQISGYINNKRENTLRWRTCLLAVRFATIVLPICVWINHEKVSLTAIYYCTFVSYVILHHGLNHLDHRCHWQLKVQRTQVWPSPWMIYRISKPFTFSSIMRHLCGSFVKSRKQAFHLCFTIA